jgi:hypothetical protein
MENSNTNSNSTDYKEYFLNKFRSLFSELINYTYEKTGEENVRMELNKIRNVLEKLNYEKIITKVIENNKIQEGMNYIVKNNFDEKVMKTLLDDNKMWQLMPSVNISKMFLAVGQDNYEKFYKILHNLYVCGMSYQKVIETIKNTNNNDEFNPFDTLNKNMVVENMDINTMFNGVEVKNINAFEMVMESFVNNKINSGMESYMENIKEDEVNTAADKLQSVLDSDNGDVKNKGTTKIISEMLNKIKTEVIELKNDKDTGGKKGMEKLLGIAQKVAGNMMTSIKENNVNVVDLWDATSSLAKKTTNSDALNMVDKIVRANLMKNMVDVNSNVNSNINSNTETTIMEDRTKEINVNSPQYKDNNENNENNKDKKKRRVRRRREGDETSITDNVSMMPDMGDITSLFDKLSKK